jgi:hypothetical protein
VGNAFQLASLARHCSPGSCRAGDLGRATRVRIAPGRINGPLDPHARDGATCVRGYQSALTTVPLCSVDTVARALP